MNSRTNCSACACAIAVLLARLVSAADDSGVAPPEGGYVSEAHEALYQAYQVAIGESDAEKTKASEAVIANFRSALDRRLIELAQSAMPERVRELQAVAGTWEDGDVGAAVAPELAGAVTAYQNAKRGIESQDQARRLVAIDQLIRGIDVLANEAEDAGAEGVLRTEARSLLAQRGGRAKFGQLEISRFDWRHGEPRFVRMKRDGDELLSIAHFGGLFAGGGESQHFALWGRAGEFGFLGHAMQANVTGGALALRDPRLRMTEATVRLVEFNHTLRGRKKLIHQSKGFCYFGGLWGHYQELSQAEVRLDPQDGFYYLSGRWETDARAWAVVVEYPEGKLPALERFEVEWRRGDPVHQPIAADDGICLMTGVSGAFSGAGESVYVRVGSDGRWHVGGTTGKLTTGVRAVVLKFKD